MSSIQIKYPLPPKRTAIEKPPKKQSFLVGGGVDH